MSGQLRMRRVHLGEEEFEVWGTHEKENGKAGKFYLRRIHGPRSVTDDEAERLRASAEEMLR